MVTYRNNKYFDVENTYNSLGVYELKVLENWQICLLNKSNILIG
ncbi:protein of unknown function [Clostridium beijerinckii]|nr:protein of unknown function [Clostridium beijerinckii]